MKSPATFVLAVIALLLPSVQTARSALPRQLSFADRVAYQYAIEEVYWRHRIWPNENPGPKPSLDALMSAAEIEKKVEDCLRNSQLLASQWQRPITTEQLQAEMERMARQTKQPEVLQELFAALDNDPFLIAECLARTVLSERLVKQLYAHDERFHGQLKRRAESELHGCQSATDMKQTSGTYNEAEWIRSDNPDSSPADARSVATIKMTPIEWDENIHRLAQQFGSTPVGRARSQLPHWGDGGSVTSENRSINGALSEIVTGVLTPLQEDDFRYYATAVLEKCKGKLRLATVAWSKAPFGSLAAETEIEQRETWAKLATDYALPAIGISQAANPSTNCADNSWIPTRAPNVPSARTAHTPVWTGSEMVIWGGYDGSSYLNTGARYNPITDSWATTSLTNAPTGRSGHTAVWTGSEMIVWGGYDGSNLNTGGRYNPSTDSWAAIGAINSPDARYGHTGIWTGSEMIVWGGIAFGSTMNTGARYDPSTDSWISTTTSNAPNGRVYPTAVWTGSEMIVWGGQDCSIGPCEYPNSGGRYNPSTNSWVATTTINAPAGRRYHTAVWTLGEMIVWGGETAVSSLNSGGRYNPSADRWLAVTETNAPTGRAYHTAVWTGSEMIVWGGWDGSYFNTGGRYSPGTDSWTVTSTTNAPPARGYHMAVWTSSEMIVWGGYGGNYLNTGARYSPSTDSWVATSITDLPPAARENHTAVWTGSEMIVWGGSNGSYLNSGGRYNPGTDSWVTTTVTNAPAARYDHTAVWTGSEMIVWGGSFMNTGARYNPSADRWLAVTETNAPTGRAYHTAVWTGSEMIIWGGSNGSYLNSGGRYNPGTDGWVTTNLTSAPAGRAEHTAVWTGSEMIVWGGYNGSTEDERLGDAFHVDLNTGGRYNPSTDSWATISTINVPGARHGHTGIWTGSEMIVWGGGSNSGPLNTGGKYNRMTGSWAATATTNAPAARVGHTAIWTDSEMIIWGGLGDNGLLNTGGRYNSTTESWVTTTTTNAPVARYYHIAVWTGGEMIVWGGRGDSVDLETGGRYCGQSSAPVAQSAVSRKVHGPSGLFDVDLPLTNTPGIECRAGGATNDYSIVVSFASAVTVNGSPQAQVISGVGTVGSGGISNGGMITISGNSVILPLTNVANAQTINVRLNGVTGSSGSGSVTVPMSILVGDTNANGAVNSGDVAQTKARLGQTLDVTNFRSDVNANGAINAGDVSQIKSLLGTGLP